MVEEWCSLPDLTKSNTTTASTSQRKVLNGMALAGSFSVVHQPAAPKLVVLESVGGLHCNSNGHARDLLKSLWAGIVGPYVESP
jgi:hypothetical protein